MDATNIGRDTFSRSPRRSLRGERGMSKDKIIAIMQSRVWPDHAQTMHTDFARELRRAGFYVWMEYPTKAFGDIRDRRLDLLVRGRGDFLAAIELDARKPRKKSIEKLRMVDGVRIVGVRGVEGVPCPEGIDAVVTMRVRSATEFEKADRRTVNRDAA